MYVNHQCQHRTDIPIAPQSNSAKLQISDGNPGVNTATEDIHVPALAFVVLRASYVRLTCRKNYSV